VGHKFGPRKNVDMHPPPLLWLFTNSFSTHNVLCFERVTRSVNHLKGLFNVWPTQAASWAFWTRLQSNETDNNRQTRWKQSQSANLCDT